MDKIYNNSDDQHVANRIIYTDVTARSLLAYWDRECTNPVTKNELKDLYLKGCIVFGTSGDLSQEGTTLYFGTPVGFYWLNEPDGSPIMYAWVSSIQSPTPTLKSIGVSLRT